ncbi:hypothetical protein WJX73_008936 [Symbiochloris irregularis]|uniref:RBR-type E3 ubiquitin transferase n=1 Tax=Symbiochloris irregularis TaxID=706552 RepID=A0AAW1P1R9_9CHLO
MMPASGQRCFVDRLGLAKSVLSRCLGASVFTLHHCPEPGCKQPLLLQRLAPFLTSGEAERWERLELDHAFARMGDITFCRRCNTPCLEDADNCAICSSCFFVFCSLCQESWHPGTQCMSPEVKLRVLRERIAGNKDSAHALVQKEYELMSLAHIQKTTKPCPMCNMAIQKQEGCNKMVCSACGAFFCYRCGIAISGYDHFSAGGCVLFEMDEIMRWEAQMAQQIHGNMQGEGAVQQHERPGRRRPTSMRCPRCGQAVERRGNNNHMACWACQQHFCFLCRTVLGKRGGLHFGKRGGCQQHTVITAGAPP